jgi:hypothetical protein
VGTSTTTAQLTAKVSRMADAVAKLPAATERPNAATAERVMGAAVSSMSGGDNRLSGAGPVGVSANPTGGGRVNVNPTGPVHLVENPTAAHSIGADGARLRLGSRWVTGPVWHRGTRGKGRWARAKSELVAPVRDDTAKAMHATTQGIFG